MTRNKKIAGLLQDIVGEPKEEQLPTSTEEGNVSQELKEALKITPEMEEALNAARSHKAGRPRKNEAERKHPNEGRATFVVDNRLIRKVKYISLVDTRLLKDVISEALSDYIDKWEGTNGPINLPTKNL